MNLQTKIYDQKGKVAIINRKITKKVKGKDVEGIRQEDMTVGEVIKGCLLSNGDDKSPASHLARYELWYKIKDVEETKFTPEEIELVSKLIAEKMDILVSAQVLKSLK